MNDETNMRPYPELELLRRDIVYFYELQSAYAFIEADIPWDMFDLRYWEYLAMPVLSEEHFLERGCLAIIMAAALSHGGNICYAFGSTPIETCRGAVVAVQYSDMVTERIRIATLSALDLAVEDNAFRDYDLLASHPESKWVHSATVRAYFRSRANMLR